MNGTIPAPIAATSSPVPATVIEPKQKFGDFGKGRYSPVMDELYSDSIRLLGLSEPQAHACAARLGIDLGRLSSAQIKGITYSKTTNKEGWRTVREICNSVKIPNSWAMSVAIICNGLTQLKKQGLDNIENSVNKDILEFINNAAANLAKP